MKSSSPTPVSARTTADIKSDPEAARKAELKAALEREKAKKGQPANNVTGGVNDLSNVSAATTLLN